MTRATVLAAEAERRDLLLARDFAGLAELLHPDLSYVHLNGSRQDRAAYLAHVERDFCMVDVQWEGLRARVTGAVALIDGTITNCLVPMSDPGGATRRFRAAGLLVWVREDRWRLIGYQGTRIE